MIREECLLEYPASTFTTGRVSITVPSLGVFLLHVLTLLVFFFYYLFSSNLLGVRKLEISYAELFYPMLNKLNTYFLDWNLVTVDHFFEIMTLFWNTIVNL